MRKIAIFLGVLCGVLCASRVVNAETVATGGPGAAFGWQTAEKQGIGTAYLAPGAEPKSRVWFTLARGIVTEMYFPRVDTAQVRDSQFLVSDGSSFLHQEQFDMESSVKRIEGSLAFEIVNKDRERRYEIRKTVWADPQSDTLYQRVLFKSFVDGLHLYYLHNPAAANSIFGDTAVRDPELAAGEEHGMFSAWHSVQSSVGWLKKSVGYVGRSDGFTDLSADFKMDFEFDRAPQGNVALTGQLNLPAKKGTYAATIAIRFANRQGELASGPLPESQPSLDSYLAGWRAYLSGLDLNVGENAPERRQKLAEHSILILKASEDKTFLGAGIASLSHPWGEAQTENEHVNPYGNSGYHVVWPRDLYHVGNAFLAVNDTHSAVAVLDRMRSVQFDDADGDWQFGTRSRKKTGSFPQNFWVDGRTHWQGYQADQTAMPVLFAYRLWKAHLVSLPQYWEMVQKAATFLAAMGPWTHQERWEENYGISPNSAGFVISALVVAAEMAFEMGQPDKGAHWLKLADSWALKDGDNLDTWTFTQNGKIQGDKGNGKYYVRVDGAKTDGGNAVWNAMWNPNFDELLVIANTHGDERFRYESEVVDGGFLELVRLGVRSAKNYFVRESIPEMDAMIRVDTPKGAGFYRYTFDRYGDEGRGRLWPFLTGERLHYEMQWLLENGNEETHALDPWLQAYENFANSQHIFAEQVWDFGDKAGEASGSATPLCWTHAEYLQVLRSLRDGKIFEEIPAVRSRYAPVD